MNTYLKIGIIGCGRAAELIYLPALKKFPAIEILGVVDPVKERRELLSAEFNNCNQYDEIDLNFINQIDAAIITTPPDKHIEAALVLLKQNKYVLVEKPLALSIERIEELIEAEASSKGSLMMGFNHRYWQPIINVKEKISDGLKIISAEIIFSGNYDSWNPISFKSDPLNDLGPHVFDLIRFIFDKEIESVTVDFWEENNLNIKIKLPGETFFDTHIAHSDRTEKSIKLISNERDFFIKLGSVRISPPPGIKRDLLDLKDTLERKLFSKSSPIKKSYEDQLMNFFNFVRENKKPQPGIKDGISAILAVEAAIKSIKNNGKEIFLNEIR